jgi:hypothetical protein
MTIVESPGLEMEDDVGETTEEELMMETGGAIGLGSSEQPKKRVEAPTITKERRFFFMITKYSLQKWFAVAKTFLLSLESL